MFLKLTTPFNLRLAAVALWFTGGMLCGNPLLGMLSMFSAALFGMAMFIERDEAPEIIRKAHQEGYFMAKKEVIRKLEGRLEVLQKIGTTGSTVKSEKAAKESVILERVRTIMRNTMLYYKDSYDNRRKTK